MLEPALLNHKSRWAAGYTKIKIAARYARTTLAARLGQRVCYFGVAMVVGFLVSSHTSSESVGNPTDAPVYSVTQMPNGQIASALNNAGDVAGTTSYSGGADSRPIMWSRGDTNSPTTAPIDEDEFSFVSQINEAGQITGSFNSDVAIVPFVWSTSDGVQRIPLPKGATSGEACGINKIGDVVGYISGDKGMRAFVRRSGSDVQELAPLPDDTSSMARRINDAGQVAGTSGNDVSQQAILWSNSGVVQPLGTLPGDTSSEAVGINVVGRVVGHSSGPSGTACFPMD